MASLRRLRARAEITSHFGASAWGADARRRDEVDVGHRRGAATAPIRALRRRAPPGCGPQGCGAQVPAGFVARSSHTAPGIARRSRLASGNCAPQPCGPAAKCPYYFFTDPKALLQFRLPVRDSAWKGRRGGRGIRRVLLVRQFLLRTAGASGVPWHEDAGASGEKG